MTESYLIKIQEPDQIPAAVIETEERCREQEKDINIILDHQEPVNVVRGYAEPLFYDGSDPDQPQEFQDRIVRRPDGGLSWYHSNTTCYMRAEHSDSTSRDIIKQRKTWLDEMKQLLQASGHGSIEDDGADIYTRDDRQLAGSSSYHSKGVDIHRGCWYADDPRSRELDSLLRFDGIDPERFYDSLEIAGDTPQQLLEERHDFEAIRASDYISRQSREAAQDIIEREEGRLSGSCILTDYDCQSCQ